ncbi:MAG: cyanophycinase [Thermoplasmata archaeon]
MTLHLDERVLTGVLVLTMVMSMTMISSSAVGTGTTYEYYIQGNPDDVNYGGTSPGLLLAGGSTDVAEAMEWMISKSGGGDFLVIRCSGTDAYNPWIYKTLGGVDSCETIIFLKDEACFDEFVLDKIRCAEALFIAGGNQWDYVRMWKGTPVEDAIHDVLSKGAPIGGTSAGLAVLGEFVFSAQRNTIDSDEALRNPYHPRLTLEQDFLVMPNMGDTITDSHFVARDRMGRLVAFMARTMQDGWTTQAHGIGIDEKVALAVDECGSVKLFDACNDGTGAAYFLMSTVSPAVCEPRTPLTFEGISVFKMTIASTFSLATWTGSGGEQYELSAVDGTLVSTQAGGAVY